MTLAISVAALGAYGLPVLVLGGLFVVLAVGLVVAERVLINYGICTVDINSGEEELEIEGGQTLLDTLYEQEIYIPSACGAKGSCGHCKVTVLSGGGPMLPTETPFFSRAQRRAGRRLACQVKVREDMEIRVPEDVLNVQMFEATVRSTRSVTPDIKEIEFSLDEPEEIHFRCGQYVQVQAPSPEGAVFRAYSISNPESVNGVVRLVVRLVPGGIGSTYLHNLEEGQKVIFTGPFGEFHLSEDPEVEIVCVGGGCGMAPIRSVVHSTLERWPERRCSMFFGCRGTDDIFYMDEFKELEKKHPNFRVVYALSDLGPDEEWDGETGFIHLSVDKYLEEDPDRQAFLCGPPPMIEAVQDVLQDKGMRPEDVFYDEF
ncbi:MAG: NADH:ubiquinone reductase (Na(+)-transporting) subunit F [Planctomycetota bacterium]